MKIAGGTLFLGLFLFLNSIELSTQSWPGSTSSSSSRSHVPLSSSPRAQSLGSSSSHPEPRRAQHITLEKLFPGSNGIHFPDIEQLLHDRLVNYPNIKILNGREMWNFLGYTALIRGHVIFGYLAGNDIEPLSRLFGERNLYAVFNTADEQWYTVLSGELQKLGVGRYLPFVIAHDQAHSVLHNRHHQENSKADDEASKAAYLKTRDYERTLREPSFDQPERFKTSYAYTQTTYNSALIKSPSYTENGGIQLIKNFYFKVYTEAYQSHAGGSSGFVVGIFVPNTHHRQDASSSHGRSVD